MGALAVNYRVHQHEVPCGGDLGGQCRPEQVVPAQGVKEEPERGAVDHDARRADQPERHEPHGLADPLAPGGRPLPQLPGQPRRAQPGHVPQERDSLAQRGLGIACRARFETVGDLGHPGDRVADQDFQQHFESRRPEAIEVYAAPAEGEQPAQRIAHHRQPAREDVLDQPGGGRGYEDPPGAAQAVRRGPIAGVPGAHHDVAVVAHGRARQHGRGLRRVLQVGVHDENPFTACVARPGDDGTAQAALPGAGRPVQEPDRHRASRGLRGQHFRCLVIAVIDEDELGVQRRDGRTEPRQQQFDAVLLVASRNDHGQLGRSVVTRKIEIDERTWQVG